MRLEDLGFRNVVVTGADKKALNRVINELKPRLVLVDCEFYHSATPFMIGLLLKRFPNLNVAAVSIGPYLPGWAVKFLGNGVKSCVFWTDGPKQFLEGLERIRDGKAFVSRSVQERILAMDEYPKRTGNLTDRHTEVAVMVCNGSTSAQIAKTLNVSVSTVDTHKSTIYYNLNVDNRNDLIRVALDLGINERDGVHFYAVGSFLDTEKKTTVRRIV
jgi:DNA-binding NarL/FixJ family response regulator